MGLETVSFVANGNINPSRFVSLDTAEDYSVLQCNTSRLPFGVSNWGTQEAPGTSADSGYAATDGKELKVFGVGEVALLEIGTGGCTRGDRLKSDADGKGVTASVASSTVVHYGAVALRSASAGEKIPVVVAFWSAVTAQ